MKRWLLFVNTAAISARSSALITTAHGQKREREREFINQVNTLITDCTIVTAMEGCQWGGGNRPSILVAHINANCPELRQWGLVDLLGGQSVMHHTLHIFCNTIRQDNSWCGVRSLGTPWRHRPHWLSSAFCFEVTILTRLTDTQVDRRTDVRNTVHIAPVRTWDE